MDPTSIPSMTGGAGGSAGPSEASGSFFTTLGGLDGSGWNVNFGQGGVASSTIPAATPSVATPAATGYAPDQFGLPNFMLGNPSTQAVTSVQSAASGISPVLLIGALVVAVVLLKKHA